MPWKECHVMDERLRFVARLLEAIFPPGMTTRNHSHPGPEAFFVVEGQQCVETAEEQRMLGPGESYHFGTGIDHVQSSPGGRRCQCGIASAAMP